MAGVRFGPTVVEPPIGVCMLVTIGIESDTLITALWFSTTTTDELAESAIRCSEAKAFSRAMAESAFTVTAVSPGCGSVIVEGIATCDAATAGRTGDVVLVNDTSRAWPIAAAQSTPRCESSVSVTSAMSASAAGSGEPERTLVQDRGQRGRIGKVNRDDVDPIGERLPIDAADDAEQASDVRDRIDDHEKALVGTRDELSVLRDQRLQQVNELGDRGGRDGHDLGDDLIARPRPVGERADDGRDSSRPGPVSPNDLVDVAGLDRRESVHVEDGPEDVEQIATRELTDGADGHRALDVRGEDVIEPDDLTDRLDDRGDVRVIEVERHQPTATRRLQRARDVGRLTSALAAVVARLRSGALSLFPRRRRGGLRRRDRR